MSEICQRCGALIDLCGYCLDETCPFSDHQQGCPIGWIGHPDHVVNETEECSCKRTYNPE